MAKNFSYGLNDRFVHQSIENLNNKKPFINNNGRLSFEIKDKEGMALVQFLLKPLNNLGLIKIKKERGLVLIKYRPDVKISFRLLEYPSLIGDGSICPVEVIKDHQPSSTFNILFPALKLRNVEQNLILTSTPTSLSSARKLIPFISMAA